MTYSKTMIVLTTELVHVKNFLRWSCCPIRTGNTPNPRGSRRAWMSMWAKMMIWKTWLSFSNGKWICEHKSRKSKVIGKNVGKVVGNLSWEWELASDFQKIDSSKPDNPNCLKALLLSKNICERSRSNAYRKIERKMVEIDEYTMWSEVSKKKTLNNLKKSLFNKQKVARLVIRNDKICVQTIFALLHCFHCLQ